MKKTKILGLATLSLVACFSVGSYLSIEKTIAEDLTPALDIVGHTLSLENNVRIKYAVSAENLTEGDALKLKINDKEVLDVTGTVTKGSETCYTFEYTGLSAKQMTDTVHAVAYVERGETTYESQTDKYSILEYAYGKLGKTEAEPTEDEDLKPLLNAMLSYGSASQVYFNYKTDTLATDNFSYVRIDNATFEDGFNYVIGKVGTQVRVYANEGYELASEPAEYLTEQNGEIWLTIPEEKTIDTASFVEKKKASEGLKYKLLDNDTYEVSGIGECTDTDIVIPTTYEGKSVTSIGYDAFRNCRSLTSVVIPDSVTLIRDTAFINCYSLTNIKVSEENSAYKDIEGNLYSKDGSVLIQYAIGKTATEFVIPDSVTTIGDYAIGLASNLTSVVIGDNVTSIGYYSISTCYNLTSVEIGDGVTSIGRYAFAFCSALTSIEIGDGVTSIAYDAFEDCPIETAKIPVIAIHYISNSNLKTLTITSGEIDSSEFWECDSLTSVEIGDGVTSISDRAFDWCLSLTNIKVSEENSKYKDIDGNLYSKDGSVLIQYAIGKTATEFIIPDSVTTIGDDAFYDCSNLTSVEIGDSVTSIGNSAFSGCSSLTSVEIPDGVTSIGYMAFYDCSNLTSVEIGDSVTSIGNYAFSFCRSLTIYCEAESKPSGWSSDWNYSNCPVVWGYKK